MDRNHFFGFLCQRGQGGGRQRQACSTSFSRDPWRPQGREGLSDKRSSWWGKGKVNTRLCPAGAPSQLPSPLHDLHNPGRVTARSPPRAGPVVSTAKVPAHLLPGFQLTWVSEERSPLGCRGLRHCPGAAASFGMVGSVHLFAPPVANPARWESCLRDPFCVALVLLSLSSPVTIWKHLRLAPEVRLVLNHSFHKPFLTLSGPINSFFKIPARILCLVQLEFNLLFLGRSVPGALLFHL